MKITSDLFQAYLKCPTKCWLRAAGEVSTGNTYADWVKAQDESYLTEQASRLVGESPIDEVATSPAMEDLKSAKWRLALNVPIQIELRSSRGDEAHFKFRNPKSEIQTDQSLLTSAATVIESRLNAVERIPSEGRGKAAQFIPIRFIYRNKLTKDDKLSLAFDAFLLSEALGREVPLGKIIHGDDHATLKVKLGARTADMCLAARGLPSRSSHDLPWNSREISRTGSGQSRCGQDGRAPRQTDTTAESARTSAESKGLVGEVRKLIDKIAALLPGETRSADSHVRESALNQETRGLGGPRSRPTPPDLVLNRHCPECEFRDRCRKIAVEKDDLSLLAGMSAKERLKLRSKGIFTVTQLSYTFRPRRRPKRMRDKREKYHHPSRRWRFGKRKSTSSAARN